MPDGVAGIDIAGVAKNVQGAFNNAGRFVYASPMRFLVTLLLCLLPVFAQDPPPAQKKGGGGGAPKNLKVLTPEELRTGVMQQYSQALGIQCNFCHVATGGKDLDDNPKKDVARKMITMVKDINSKFPPEAGKVFVTCYTCHRGKTEPDIKPAAGQP